MKKFFLLLAIFFTIFLLGLFLLRPEKFTVEGKITDLSTGSPLELVKIKAGDDYTFTNSKGYFSFWEAKKYPPLTLETPKDYEPFEKSLNCSKKEKAGFFTYKLTCEANLTPKVTTALRRIIGAEKGHLGESEEKIKGRLSLIWDLTYKDSQALWKDPKEFSTLLWEKDRIEKKLKRNTSSYGIFEEVEMLKEWKDPQTEKVYKKVAEIEVEKTLANGRKIKTLEHLVKKDGYWQYFLPYGRGEVVSFIERNKWILEVER